MRPWSKSLLHAAGFIGLLVLLALLATQLNQVRVDGANNGILSLSKYWHNLLLKVGLSITLAVSLNLILGMAGQFSLGHAGFMAAGAFLSTVLAGKSPLLLPQLHFWCDLIHLSMTNAMVMVMLTGMISGAILAGLLGLLVGMPTLRLRGDYLAIATLGCGEIIYVLIRQSEYLGGSTGVSLYTMRSWSDGIINFDPAADPTLAAPSPDMVTLAQSVSDYMDNMNYLVGFFWVFALAALTIYIVHNIKYATAGRALLAIREDPVASEAVGVPTTRYKVGAFVIGAALVGMAGGLLSHHQSINPEDFRFMRSIEIVAMVILGGQGSITGSVVAAIAPDGVPEAIRNSGMMDVNILEKWRMVVYSIFIILAMLFRPQGLFGRYEFTGDPVSRWHTKSQRKKKRPQLAASTSNADSTSLKPMAYPDMPGVAAPATPQKKASNAGRSSTAIRAADPSAWSYRRPARIRW